MKLVASMPVRNERRRYLAPCIAHLLEFCDEVRVLDDGSTDGTFKYLQSLDGVAVRRNPGPPWTEHEGRLRQHLLEWTLEAEPTHVLAIDADEFVTDGYALRARLGGTRSYTLTMREVWDRSAVPWGVREDGGWRSHPIATAYRVPPELDASWQMLDRKLACDRVPQIIRDDHRAGLAKATGVDILHLGWSRPSERAERHRRYVEVDGGNFHASAHLDSIMWPVERVELHPYTPPDALLAALRRNGGKSRRRRQAKPRAGLSVAVMAHPRRRAFVRNLRRRLPGAAVAWDRRDDEWDTGARALLLYDPEASHHMVLQDDAILSRDLLANAERCALAAGEHPVSLYAGSPRPRPDLVAPSVARAEQQGVPWLELPGPWWGVAVIFPTADIEPLIEWGNHHPGIPEYDGRVATWYMNERNLRCWYTVPSLVDHRHGDGNPSIFAGRGTERKAYAFIGSRASAEGIDWSIPPLRPSTRPGG